MLACTPCVLVIVQDLTKTEKVLSNRTFCFNFSSLWQKNSAKEELSFTLEKSVSGRLQLVFHIYQSKKLPFSVCFVIYHIALCKILCDICSAAKVMSYVWSTWEGTSVNHAKLRALLSSEGFCWVDFLCCFREATPKNGKIWKTS